MATTDIPAVLDGDPINADRPFTFASMIGEEEKRAVQAVLDDGELSGFIASPGEAFWGGKRVRQLQDDFCTRFDSKYAVAVNSATSALYCAMSAIRIGPGDEVITSPYTMSATSTAVLMTGAVPVFADIESQTFGLDPTAVESAITPQTRAILAVNIFGHPARLYELRAIADAHKLYLIEDNSQAPGALHQNRLSGTIGDIGVFSFNRHKVMQCGEGGVLITNHDDLFTRAALARNHGEAVVKDMGITDIVNTVGLNLRMTEMEAAVAIEQLKKLDRLNEQRIELADALTDALADIECLTPPAVAHGDRHVYYVYALKYDAEKAGMPRDLFARAMLAEGLFIRAGYLRPTYMEPLYQQKICFGEEGYPFTANPRNTELSYAAGICPTCEHLQDHELMITAVMQPPQNKTDMTRWADGARKVLHHSERIRRQLS